MLHKIFMQAGYLGFCAGSWLASGWAGAEPSEPQVVKARVIVVAGEGDAACENCDPQVFEFQTAAPKVLKRIGSKGQSFQWTTAEAGPKVVRVIGRAKDEAAARPHVIMLKAAPQAGKAPLQWTDKDDKQHLVLTVVGDEHGALPEIKADTPAEGKPHVIMLKADKPAGKAPIQWASEDGKQQLVLTVVGHDEDEEEAEDEEEEAEEKAEVEAEAAIEVEGVQIPKMSEYFIGVECYPVEDAVRKQLQLGENGLWIEGVVDDSPASKAGFQQNDVIVAAEGKDLKEVADLIDVIDKAKDSEIKFTVVRDGKKETVKVTPAKREQGDVIVNVPEPEDHLKMLEKIRPGQDANFRFFSPGVVVDDEYEFPENLTISVTRKGKGPAQVVVERGDDKWTTTSDHLESLPEDVRPHVERMVGGGPMRMMIRGLPERMQNREMARAVEGAARAAAERARGAAERARGAAERARARAGEDAEAAEEAGEASGDRLNRLMGRLEKLFEEKAEKLEKLLEEKAQEVEKRIEEQSQEQEKESDEDES